MKLKTGPTPQKVAVQAASFCEDPCPSRTNSHCQSSSGIADSLVPAATEQADPAQSINSFQLVTKNKKTQDQGSRG